MKPTPTIVVTAAVEPTTIVVESPPPDWTLPPTGVCVRCGARPATLWWSDRYSTLELIHGAQLKAWCRRCAVQAQLDHCRAEAARIPGLEAELAAEGAEGAIRQLKPRRNDRFEYRYEAHGSNDNQRALMERLGREGWEFVAFVNWWGPQDGKTMIFKRRTADE